MDKDKIEGDNDVFTSPHADRLQLQIFNLPIVKTDEDVVTSCAELNKILSNIEIVQLNFLTADSAESCREWFLYNRRLMV